MFAGRQEGTSSNLFSEKKCGKDLVIADMRKILKNDEREMNHLLERSLKVYQEKHHDSFYFCPAPDCNMFVDKNILPKTWKCPLCKNDICVRCNVVYHKGYTCDVYQGSKLDPDYSFKVWQKTTNRCKRCPKCQTAIEKTEGCNHMTCRQCQAHFCWLCVQNFQTAQEAYTHIEREHPNLLFQD